MSRLEQISKAIQRCSDKHQLNLLNHLWWKEFFTQNYNLQQWVERMRELEIGTK